MEKLLKVSSSPHVRDGVTTQRLMFDVVIAMIPASVYGVWQFGMNALLVLIATVIASVAAEYLYEKLMHKPITISDGSAVVTGTEYAAGNPGLDPGSWCILCNHRCKTALRWSGTELHEPGTGSQMFPSDFLRSVYE